MALHPQDRDLGSWSPAIGGGSGLNRSIIDEIYRYAYWMILTCMDDPEVPSYGYILLAENAEDDPSGVTNTTTNSDDDGNGASIMELAEYSCNTTKTTIGIHCDRTRRRCF